MSGWTDSAVVYEIYPRSFADSTGDGVGDLRGIISRIGYLKCLGVDAVWLAPCYPSALADGGYDVDDPRDIDPVIGSLADFDELVAGLHGAGIRIILDVVPNHTSNRRDWFQEALSSEHGSPERDRYLFRPGRGADGAEPPNDWRSAFGGPAWEAVGDGSWYPHTHAPEQPDLNWANTDVRADALETLRFWAVRGVDGFRVDVAHALAKDLSEPYPSWSEVVSRTAGDGEHPLQDRAELDAIYRDWRRLLDSFDPPLMAVAEAAVPRGRRLRYASALGQAFNFDLLEASFDAAEYRRVIEEGLADMAATGRPTTWLLGSHDAPRGASRYGLAPSALGCRKGAIAWLLTDGRSPQEDRALGLRRARAAALAKLALPGSVYLYHGEELGLFEVADLPRESLQDPLAARSQGAEKGRDGCRVPLPWTTDRSPRGQGSSFGFGADGAHLPQPDDFGDRSVEANEGDADSTLHLYRAALAFRRAEQSRLDSAEGVHWHATSSGALHWERSGWHCLINFSAEPVPLPPGEVILVSGELDAAGWLPAATTVWTLDR